MVKNYFKSWHRYYKLQQKVIYKLQITAQKYYKLHQFITKYDSSNFPELLIIITNCVSFCYKLRFQNSYKFRQKLLQVAAGVASVP